MELRRGAVAAEVVPWAGGLVRRLTVVAGDGPVDVLHVPDHAEPSTRTPNLFGLWPLVPFANRAFGARVDDGIDAFDVPANEPGGTANIHGFGWQSEWSVVDADADRLRLRHRRDAGVDPYRYCAEEAVALTEAGLRVDLSVTNEADRPLPFGLGLHPWFPADPDTRLVLRAARVLTLGPGYRPTGVAPVEGADDFAGGGRVRGAAERAASYLDWDGRARIEHPSRGYSVVLTASANLSAPLLWAPPDAPFFCLEPQTHGIGAPSEAPVRRVSPLRRLAPGETLAVWVELAVGPLPA